MTRREHTDAHVVVCSVVDPTTATRVIRSHRRPSFKWWRVYVRMPSARVNDTNVLCVLLLFVCLTVLKG